MKLSSPAQLLSPRILQGCIMDTLDRQPYCTQHLTEWRRRWACNMLTRGREFEQDTKHDRVIDLFLLRTTSVTQPLPLLLAD
jgi:hypothetical protein